MANYRHKLGYYFWKVDSFGHSMKLVLPPKGRYELRELRAGPVGEVCAVFRCTWLDARKFPGGRLLGLEHGRN